VDGEGSPRTPKNGWWGSLRERNGMSKSREDRSEGGSLTLSPQVKAGPTEYPSHDTKNTTAKLVGGAQNQG